MCFAYRRSGAISRAHNEPHLLGSVKRDAGLDPVSYWRQMGWIVLATGSAARLYGAAPAPPAPHQGEPEDPSEQHRVEQLAAPHLPICHRCTAPFERGQTQCQRDERHESRVEEIASP